MKESARAALSYAKSHADELEIPEERFTGKDVHVSCSCRSHSQRRTVGRCDDGNGARQPGLSGVAVRHDIAMTGGSDAFRQSATDWRREREGAWCDSGRQSAYDHPSKGKPRGPRRSE